MEVRRDYTGLRKSFFVNNKKRIFIIVIFFKNLENLFRNVFFFQKSRSLLKRFFSKIQVIIEKVLAEKFFRNCVSDILFQKLFSKNLFWNVLNF